MKKYTFSSYRKVIHNSWLIMGLCLFSLNGYSQEITTTVDKDESALIIGGDTLSLDEGNIMGISSPDTLIVGEEVLEIPDDITEIYISPDTVIVEAALADSTIQEAFAIADSVFVKEVSPAAVKDATTFKPNSTKAVLYSIVPGLGQIYNRKYWKLPLVYGGFMGFMYAITWNNRMYQDYYNAYMGIMDDYAVYQDDPEKRGPDDWDKAWKDFIASQDYESYLTNESFHDQLKRKKDYFRRYRDLSIILSIGFYFIVMVDAYVDAELFDFDISPDLSMRIVPEISPRTAYSSHTFGVNLSFKF